MEISQNVVVGAIDVGSPKNIGWAIIDSAEAKTGQNLDEFIVLFSTAAENKPAALGFKAPMFIPCRDQLSRITTQRSGENGRPSSAGAGATAITIGLAAMDYTLRNLRERMSDVSATLDWHDWPNGTQLLLFEAFVSGINHAGPCEHWVDALYAAKGFQAALPDLDTANSVSEQNVLSLDGTCLARTGWCKLSFQLLSEPCLVIRPEAEGDQATLKSSSGSSVEHNSAMNIDADQREAWKTNPENIEYEKFIDPLYKDKKGKPDLEVLYQLAELNGVTDAREQYTHLNTGQIVMAIRSRLRPMWKRGTIKASQAILGRRPSNFINKGLLSLAPNGSGDNLGINENVVGCRNWQEIF